jgi:triosephosphate isomerase
LRNKLVVGNWKLNGSLRANAELLAALGQKIAAKEGKVCAVCAPAPYLAQVRELLAGKPIAWGGQDASRYEKGAYTGEIAAAMLKELDCRFCIVGHSERRALFGETDEVVAEKLGRVKSAGITPIACVGETLAEREAGQTEQVVGRQVDAITAMHGAEAMRGVVFAYEPVWAIGTGKTATPEQAQEVHAFLRKRLASVAGVEDAHALAQALPILYGGSVKAGNAAELFAMPDIDGGLVGGASLIADEFVGIWSAL